MPEIPIVSGWVKDPVDDRDHEYRAAVQPVAVARPAIFRASQLGPILPQGGTPHCVTYATTSVRNRHEKIETGVYVFGADERTYPAGSNPSAEWLYVECKKIDGYRGDGTNARAALTVMNQQGLRLGSRSYRVGQYARIRTADEIMEAIFLHGPVLLGMDIDTGWQRPVAGRIALPNGQIFGGHEIEVVGYRDRTTFPIRDRGLWIKNSWGSWWGALGYARLPFEHLDRYPAYDAWWVTDGVDLP